METVDPGVRQSGLMPATLPDQHQSPTNYQSYREAHERPHRDRLNMATATILQPTATYPPPPSYSSAYPQSVANMISTSESRKADENDPSKRQSLPSISEVISGAKSYPPPTPSSLQPSSSLPSPFTSATARPYAESEKHTSPQPLRPASCYPPRQEPLPLFSDSTRPPFNGRHGLPPVSDRRPSPSGKSDILPQHHLLDLHKDPRSSNGSYPLQSLPSASAPPASYPTTSLPRGQMPLPSYPISPRHAPPHGYGGQYDQRGPHPVMDDPERGLRHQSDYNNSFEAGLYQEALGRLGQASRTTFNFAEAYARIAHEQHSAHHIPERLPTEQEVADMIGNNEIIRQSLEYVRDVVQQSIRRERAREGAKVKASSYEEDDDVPMYGENVKAQYAMTEVKKRRGRAAPPGRCHSCNRVDTPEWRRGPDGARTLCNACGLHYAKLERKRQLEARSIRPKADERS